MPNQRLRKAVKDLKKFYDISTREDLILEILSPKTDEGPAVESETATKIANLIISTAEGGLEASKVVLALKEFGAQQAEIEKLISIYYGKVGAKNLSRTQTATMESILKDAANADRLSLIQLNNITITPAGRDVNGVVLLLNSIPTIELSRCMPFLTIEVQTGRPPLSADLRPQVGSLIQFLQGSADFSQSEGNRKLLLGLKGERAAKDDDSKSEVTSISGMELFTSPQTLVDPDPSLDQNRAAAVIDRFRPFMSIDKLHIDVTPQVGFFAYRSADLDLTLHDRSRLSEIADFVKPDLYSNTELFIEYGWSHPDDTGDNVFGTLLNAMRAREKYGIVNSSFSFTRTGEVKIKLKLFTKGASDIRIVRIGEGGKNIGQGKMVRDLQRKIGDLRRKLQLRRPKGFKEIRGEQALFASAEDLDSSLELTKEERASLQNFIKGSKGVTNTDTKKLVCLLRKLFGNNGRGGDAKTFRSQVIRIINARLNALGKTNDIKKEDPFQVSAKDRLGTATEDKARVRIPASLKFVSFGRLMLMYVGVPLAATGKYRDVQLIFYPFNGKAGAASQLNISEFLIRIDELRQGFKSIGIARRGAHIPLRDFMQYVANNFIDDMSSFNYGLKDFYHNTIDPKTGVRTVSNQRRQLRKKKEKGKVVKDAKGNAVLVPVPKRSNQQLFDAVAQRLRSFGTDGQFKMPQIDVIIETVPGGVTEDGQSIAGEREKTILKLHFIDKTATPYESLSQIILNSREEDLRTLGKLGKTDVMGHKATYNKFLMEAAKKFNDGGPGLIKKIRTGPQGNVYEFVGNAKNLKRFLTTHIPTLTYGTNNTGIIDASFQTIQEPMLSTIHMLRAGQSDSISPEGLAQGNLPLRTLPARATLRTLGCPLVQYMQQFFIDFGTNTTIDNIYGVTKLTHDIAPGKFETSMDMIPLDAYGRYESLAEMVGVALQKLEKQNEDSTDASAPNQRPC